MGMRRMVCLVVSVALFVVSSAPLVSAVACEMPEAAVGTAGGEAMGQGGHHGQTVSLAMASVAGMHAGHAHSVTLAGDWQHCRIECGCGCHRSIDTLPHLLAPHSVDSGFQSDLLVSERVAAMTASRLSDRDSRVISPPPDFV